MAASTPWATTPWRGFGTSSKRRRATLKSSAVVLRINSPGGSVTACDVMAEELRQFRAETHKPVVACLMDVAPPGAYLIAAEATGSSPTPRP